MTRRPAVFALLAAAVMSAACGTTGGDGVGVKSTGTSSTTDTSTNDPTTTDEPTTSSTETTEPESTTTEGDDPDADARAAAANLVREDLPDGWTSQPHQEGDDSNLIDDCAAQIDLDAVTLAKADSDDFSKGDLSANKGQQVQSSTRVFEDEATATAVVSVLSEPTFVDCADTTLKAEFSGSTVEGSLESVPDVEGYGDQAEALQGQFKITDPSVPDPVDLEIALLAVRTGDIATVITGLSLGGPGDDIFERLANAVAGRQVG